MASYSVNPDGVEWARHLIDTGQYVLDSDWGKVQPRAEQQNNFLKNVAMFGGLVLAATDTEGAPSLSWRAKRVARRTIGSH